MSITSAAPTATPGAHEEDSWRAVVIYYTAAHIYPSVQNSSYSGVCLPWDAGSGRFSLLSPVLDNHTQTPISSWTRDAWQHLFLNYLMGKFSKISWFTGKTNCVSQLPICLKATRLFFQMKLIHLYYWWGKSNRFCLLQPLRSSLNIFTPPSSLELNKHDFN